MATLQFNSSAVILDDTSPLISYSSGWVLAGSSAEYNQTRHGASTAGQTATFTFNGTSIAVYGSLGSIDVYGQPQTQYSIDGEVSAVYDAPIITPGTYTDHTLFYCSPPLTAGVHTLGIENLNGTAPSEFWLDYIIYVPSDLQAVLATSTSQTSAAPTTSSSSNSVATTTTPTSTPPVLTPPTSTPPTSTPPTSTPPTSNSPTSTASTSTTLASSSSTSPTSTVPTRAATTLTNPPLPTAPATITTSVSSTSSGTAGKVASAALSSKSTNVGAIAGSVVGGVVGLALIFAALFFFYRRKRNTGVYFGDGILAASSDARPFASWPNDSVITGQNFRQSTDIQSSLGSPSQHMGTYVHSPTQHSSTTSTLPYPATLPAGIATTHEVRTLPTIAGGSVDVFPLPEKASQPVPDSAHISSGSTVSLPRRLPDPEIRSMLSTVGDTPPAYTR
ncbi:uncharacterized protein FIBRA_05471 [Fibroporia radiculosa]|uniref:Uncharacterized protein n=1 Tax=Fibroporia radiculosa TaxID=599839 RepID=J4HXK8_9APHY|nr:uncharacterized protein FIBRA_05471 [Fibroporia radiculosa]CCM03342.1 predicted protein [Fibroporia radiculosa]